MQQQDVHPWQWRGLTPGHHRGEKTSSAWTRTDGNVTVEVFSGGEVKTDGQWKIADRVLISCSRDSCCRLRGLDYFLLALALSL